MIPLGRTVRLTKLPPWVSQLPDESQRVFEACVGRCFVVQEIDAQGLYGLDVSADIDPSFGGYGNDIRVEAEFLQEVP